MIRNIYAGLKISVTAIPSLFPLYKYLIEEFVVRWGGGEWATICIFLH